jgi:hypothetical protein
MPSESIPQAAKKTLMGSWRPRKCSCRFILGTDDSFVHKVSPTHSRDSYIVGAVVGVVCHSRFLPWSA